MEQQPIIIAINVSGAPQGFLGSVIQSGAQSQISDLYFQNEITGSSELRALINSVDIVINNGTDDLTPAQAITLCSYPFSMLNATTSGTDNASVGTSTLENITTGDCNTAIGDQALPSLTTGSDNIAVGTQSGINYTENESDNILLGHPGETGESGTIRIGTSTQTSAHIAGIHGVTPAGSASTQESVIIDSNGQLGSAASFPRLIESYIDATLTTTTSASLRTRMNTTIPILLAGDYSLNISYCWNHNGQQGTRTDFISVITFDGTILGNSPANSLSDTHRQEPKDADGSGGLTGTNQQYSWSKTFILENVTAGSKSLTLQYRSSLAGTTSSIWNIVYILNYINTAPPDPPVDPCEEFSLKNSLFSDPAVASSNFGNDVGISGDYAIIAAYRDDGYIGAAYIFSKDGSGDWSQLGKIVADDGVAGDIFGNSVAISGDYAIVGASNAGAGYSYAGAAYIFQRDGSDWNQTAKLVASDTTSSAGFGGSVAISGDFVIVGAKGEDTGGANAGQAYIFQKDGSDVWSETEILVASDVAAGSYFGASVAISGDFAIVGAYKADPDGDTDAGQAYIFQKDGSDVWSETEVLVASDATAEYQFGYNVDIDGDYAVIGSSPLHYTSYPGSVYIFSKDGSDNWTQAEKIVTSDTPITMRYGYMASISGNYLIVGTYQEDNVYLYNRNCGGTDTWGLVEKIPNPGSDGDLFGRSVTIDGDHFLCGAALEDTGGAAAGASYMYLKDTA